MRAALLIVALAIVGALAGFVVAEATVDEGRPCRDVFILSTTAACAAPTADRRWVEAGAGAGMVAGAGVVALRRR